MLWLVPTACSAGINRPPPERQRGKSSEQSQHALKQPRFSPFQELTTFPIEGIRGVASKRKGSNRERAQQPAPFPYLEAENKSDRRKEIINDHRRMHMRPTPFRS